MISQVIKSRIKANVSRLLDIRVVKRSIENIPVVRKIYPFVHRTHPFDRFYGIHTGGFVPVEQLHPDPSLRSLINPYLGSQPSVVRKALAALGDVRDYAFVDLGCGLGRATTVASEFPFRVVMGVELASALAAEARANAATVAYRYPARPKVTITEANVLDFPFPPGKLVLFNYNAFGSELIEQTIKRCDAELASGDLSHLFFIYYNPVHSPALDQSRALRRFYVAQIPYDKSEIGFGPDRDDIVVIWQSVRGAVATPYKAINRKIIAPNRERAALAE